MLTLTVVYGIEADTIGQLTREVPPLYRLGRRAASHERGTHVGLRRSNKWHQAKELVTIAGIEAVTIGQLTCEVQGYLAHKKVAPPLEPPSGSEYSPTVGS